MISILEYGPFLKILIVQLSIEYANETHLRCLKLECRLSQRRTFIKRLHDITMRPNYNVLTYQANCHGRAAWYSYDFGTDVLALATAGS
jgi:hypothetical protein